MMGSFASAQEVIGPRWEEEKVLKVQGNYWDRGYFASIGNRQVRAKFRMINFDMSFNRRPVLDIENPNGFLDERYYFFNQDVFNLTNYMARFSSPEHPLILKLRKGRPEGVTGLKGGPVKYVVVVDTRQLPVKGQVSDALQKDLSESNASDILNQLTQESSADQDPR